MNAKEPELKKRKIDGGEQSNTEQSNTEQSYTEQIEETTVRSRIKTLSLFSYFLKLSKNTKIIRENRYIGTRFFCFL